MEHIGVDYSIDFVAKQFAIEAHNSTNHLYDGKPYEFHLQMVVDNAIEFLYLMEPEYQNKVIAACWLHDTIEDCRVTYNDIKQKFGEEIAEIVRACTHEVRGRNREERMSFEVYADIRRTNGALFVKLCDRLANVQYSYATQSSMLKKYKAEQARFEFALRDVAYESMFDRINQILNQ